MGATLFLSRLRWGFSMIRSSRVSVGTTPTALSGVDRSETDQISGFSAVIKNPSSSSASVFLGADDVTTATGFELEAGAAVEVNFERGEEVYGRVASGTVTVHVLAGGVAS